MIFGIRFPVEGWDFELLQNAFYNISETKMRSANISRAWVQFNIENVFLMQTALWKVVDVTKPRSVSALLQDS